MKPGPWHLGLLAIVWRFVYAPDAPPRHFPPRCHDSSGSPWLPCVVFREPGVCCRRALPPTLAPDPRELGPELAPLRASHRAGASSAATGDYVPLLAARPTTTMTIQWVARPSRTTRSFVMWRGPGTHMEVGKDHIRGVSEDQLQGSPVRTDRSRRAPSTSSRSARIRRS